MRGTPVRDASLPRRSDVGWSVTTPARHANISSPICRARGCGPGPEFGSPRRRPGSVFRSRRSGAPRWPTTRSRSGRRRRRGPRWCPHATGWCAAASPRQPWPAAPVAALHRRPAATGSELHQRGRVRDVAVERGCMGEGRGGLVVLIPGAGHGLTRRRPASRPLRQGPATEECLRSPRGGGGRAHEHVLQVVPDGGRSRLPRFMPARVTVLVCVVRPMAVGGWRGMLDRRGARLKALRKLTKADES